LSRCRATDGPCERRLLRTAMACGEHPSYGIRNAPPTIRCLHVRRRQLVPRALGGSGNVRNLLAEGSYTEVYEIRTAIPEVINHGVEEARLGTRISRPDELGSFKRWAAPLSTGRHGDASRVAIQRVAPSAWLHSIGNGKAPALAWNLPAPVPVAS